MNCSYALLPYFGLVCFSLSFSVAEIRLFRSLFVEVAMINRVAFSLENLRGIVRVEMPKKDQILSLQNRPFMSNIGQFVTDFSTQN